MDCLCGRAGIMMMGSRDYIELSVESEGLRRDGLYGPKGLKPV